MDRFVVLSGCSGGGKSTLLGELARRGHATVAEPGRRIVTEARASGRDDDLPWVDPVRFAHRAIELALADHDAARAHPGLVFFDRSLVDALAALTHLTGEDWLQRLGWAVRYHRRVFLVPPWPEIRQVDEERRHGMDEALAEAERLDRAFPRLGYDVVVLPRVSVVERAELLLAQLGRSPR